MAKGAGVTAVLLVLSMGLVPSPALATDMTGLGVSARDFVEQAELQTPVRLCGREDPDEVFERVLGIAVGLAQDALRDARKAYETRRISDLEQAVAELTDKQRDHSALVAVARERRREDERLAREMERKARDRITMLTDAIYQATNESERGKASLALLTFHVDEYNRTGDRRQLPGIKADLERLGMLYPWLQTDLRELETRVEERTSSGQPPLATAAFRSCRG